MIAMANRLQSSLCLVCLAHLLFLIQMAFAESRPNVILLMGDDHGWGETGYNGHPHLKTPVLDEMATIGLRLDRFYSAHPSCSPTRGSVITGRHPNRYGTFAPGHSIRPEEIGIAYLMGQAGYACGHFGKWHLGPVKADSPTNPGGLGFSQWLSHDNFFELNPWLSKNGGAPIQFQGESSQIIVEHALEFIAASQSRRQPFFVVVWFGSPHEPYSGYPEDLALYANLPEAYAKKNFKLTSNETGLQVSRPLNEVLQERYAEITAMDRSIGQLRDWLKENALRDNTLLWYCGDNGTPGDGIVTSELRGQKGNLYEGGIRVPGLIEWPARIKSPSSSAVNSVTSDILPTVCELAEVALTIDRPLDGISLASLIAGTMTNRPSPICFWDFPNKGKGEPYIAPKYQEGTTPLAKKQGNLYTRNFLNVKYPEIREEDKQGSRAILDNQFKLVLTGNDSKLKRELYDVRNDPNEKNNLLESNADLADALEQKLLDWQSSVLKSLTGADYH